jgi:alkylation response protein AidB-like acyl-CoA dehydrogenase
MPDLLERARALADDVLFPSSLTTDAAPLVPKDLLDLLAEEGFYGLVGPREAGGMGADKATANGVVEAFAGGCLATAFVWLQHQHPVRAVEASRTPGLRDAWLAPLCRGRLRAGIALAGERPGPPLLRADGSPDGLILDGEAPWVTGWGRIDVVLVAARIGDRVVRVLVDAVDGPTLTVDRLHPVAADASGTVTLRFRRHRVPSDRVLGQVRYTDVLAGDAAGLRGNGSLALGVASRCCRMLGSSELDGQLAEIRGLLDAAGPASLPSARAAASAFAMRAAAALVTAQGARSILRDAHAQLLAREALFLLVFGSRPAIKDALGRRLTARDGG